jgi:1,4-dihydroxy-6-naphthoate synthase
MRIGHSPDADDAFIFWGLAKGLAEVEGFEVEHVIEPIEDLNRRALRAELEVTAISAHAYAFLADRYALLSCGGSFGRGYGPVVAARTPVRPEDLEGRRLAVPGELTTAYLLARMYLPSFEAVQVPFDKVFDAVNEGRADAALAIHEGQITYRDHGFTAVMDLGEVWSRETSLPLPLGLDVVRRDLGEETMRAVWRGLKNSIHVALVHREGALDYAMEFGRGMKRSLADRFIGMYANKDSEEMGKEGVRALETLYSKAARLALIPSVPDVMVIGE